MRDGGSPVYGKMAKPSELQIVASKKMQKEFEGFEPRTSSMPACHQMSRVFGYLVQIF